MANWYYYNSSGEKIEVTGGQLKELAKQGVVTPETMVETEEGKAAPARRVKQNEKIIFEPREKIPIASR